jgi:beta-fructofuranosidase
VSAAPLAAEIRLDLDISLETRSVSLAVRHDRDRAIQTVITFDIQQELITIDRSRSTDRKDINIAPEQGPFTLFRFANGQIEPLQMTILLDHDVLEVFANERFALATRVYTEAEHSGISIASDGPVVVREAKVCEMGRI